MCFPESYPRLFVSQTTPLHQMEGGHIFEYGAASTGLIVHYDSGGFKVSGRYLNVNLEGEGGREKPESARRDRWKSGEKRSGESSGAAQFFQTTLWNRSGSW